MSPDSDSPHLARRKPSLSQWGSFAHCLENFLGLPANEKLTAASAIALEFSPFAHWAVTELSGRHALLVDEPGLHSILFGQVLRMLRVPSNMDIFTLGLQSAALKRIVAERSAQTSSLTCAQPAWTGFRNRFNSLNRADRTHLLTALPRTSQTAASPQVRTLPDGQSIKLWHEVADGVPQNALPIEWQRFAAENDPAQVQRIAELLKPTASAESTFALPNIILSRESSAKTVKKLGRWLFRAAATQEQLLGDSSMMELILPDWVLPKSRGQFLDELSGIFKLNGGVPEEPELRLILLQSQNSLERGLWLPDSLNASSILNSLHNLGEMRCNTSALFGLHLARLQDKAGSEMAYSRQLNQATTSKEVATALANLAGIRIKNGDLDEADRMLREAVLLNPWSRVATNLLGWLRKAKTSSSSGESHAQ